MLSSTLSRRATSTVATINTAAKAITTNTPAASAVETAISSSTAAPLGPLVRYSSTMAENDESLEYTPVLKLNMLQDNPGAVQKVSKRDNDDRDKWIGIFLFCLFQKLPCPMCSNPPYFLFTLVAHRMYRVIFFSCFLSICSFVICLRYCRNAVLVAELVRPRERPLDEDTKAKRLVPVDPSLLPLREVKHVSSNCCPSADSPTNGTRPICYR